jgi:hypothetical protein
VRIGCLPSWSGPFWSAPRSCGDNMPTSVDTFLHHRNVLVTRSATFGGAVPRVALFRRVSLAQELEPLVVLVVVVVGVDRTQVPERILLVLRAFPLVILSALAAAPLHRPPRQHRCSR